VRWRKTIFGIECATSVYNGPTQLLNEVMSDFTSTHQKAAVYIRGVQMKPLVTHIIVSDVREAVFTRSRQH